MRISDWSSDVCSSDLVPRRIAEGPAMSEQAVAKSRRSEASAELRAPAGVDLVEWYFEKGWTDGLPVVPPTPGKMSAMIEALGGEPDLVECRLPPRGGSLTRPVLAANMEMRGVTPAVAPVGRAAVPARAGERGGGK